MIARKILVDRGESPRLARLFNCTDRTVYRALQFETDSELAQRIRTAAMERGGFMFKRRANHFRQD